MKVLTRSCYEAATNCSGRIRSDRQRPVAAANRDRPFLSEHSDDSRLRYYKGGLAKRNPPSSLWMADYASLIRPTKQVGWVERSETHHRPTQETGGFRFALPTLRCFLFENRIRKFGVVPAQAGTHNHRYYLLERAEAPASSNHAHSWLWAPAFAGATRVSAAHQPFRNTLTKNPSVPVRRGVISQPSSERSAACAKSSALSQSTLTVSSGGTTENSGWRARKARTCSPFSAGSTEQVM